MPGRETISRAVASAIVAAAACAGCGDPPAATTPAPEPALAKGTLTAAVETPPAPAADAPSLAWYAKEEDRLRKELEDATHAKDEARKTELTALYKELLAKSDAYAERTFTPEFMESVPWTDLLSGDAVRLWTATSGAPAPSVRFSDGGLEIMPGVACVLARPQDELRHFVLDMEFKAEGVTSVLFHVPPAPNPPDNRQCYAYDLDATHSGLTPGLRYDMLVSFVAGRLTVRFDEASGIAPWAPDPTWFKRRRGGIAFVLQEGARLTITRLRVKDLSSRFR